MKILLSAFGGIAAIILQAGCVSSPETSAAAEGYPAIERRSSDQRTVSDVALPSHPDGELRLRQAVELSMARSPKLIAFGWEVQRAQALEFQAGLWSNPEIAAEVENIGGSGELAGIDAAETTLSLAQTFPLGRDIDRRRELAGQRMRLTNWEYEVARLEVMVEVTKRFVEALAADRRITLARQELELAETIEEITTTRIEAGDASPVELMRAEVPLITAQVGLNRAERLRDAAYRRLSLMWGAHQVRFDRVIGDLDQVPAAPEPEVLVRHINNNPSVALWTAAIGERIAERRLAEAEAIPDLTARLGVRNEKRTGDTALVVGLSLPLPLFDRRQGEIAAARKGEMASRERQREASLRIESMLSLFYAELLSAQDEAVALRERALPAAERAYDATYQAFAEGEFAFLDVLDAQRTLFSLQRRYLDALVAYHTMTAEIESLIGQRLTDLADTSNLNGEREE